MSTEPRKATRSEKAEPQQKQTPAPEPKQAAPESPIPIAKDITADARFEEWQGEGAQAHPGRRRKKKSFGLERQKLAYPPRAGFHRHWANDIPGRVRDLEDRGYAFVMGADGKPVSRTVGTRDGGGGMTAFLMEIPQKWYDEDKAAMHAEIDAIDQAINRGSAPGGVEAGKGDIYVPDAHPIRMETTTGRYAEDD